MEKEATCKTQEEKFNFLNKHFMYATMNSWNGLYSIARNVKIHNLNVKDSAYDMLEIQEYQWSIEDIIENFNNENPQYKIYFNGRSGGYMVLYNKDNNSCAILEDIQDYDNFKDFKEYYKEDTEYYIERDYKIVKAFNKTVSDCIETLEYYCDNYTIEETEEEIVKIIKVKVLKENGTEQTK